MDNNISKKGYLEGFLRSVGQTHKWQKRFYVLYRSSVQCQPRLDYFPDERSFHSDKAMRKTIYIEEIRSVQPHQEEGRPFCLQVLTDSQKDHILSAQTKKEANQWLNAIKEVHDKFSRVSDVLSIETDNEDADDEVEEFFYDCHAKYLAFEVSVQQTEAADRCGISEHPFTLLITPAHMVLIAKEDPETMFSWQFSHIRRYGRNKLTFLFEAGRKCTSGPGMFILRTREGQRIFQEIRSYTKTMRKSDTDTMKSQKSVGGPAHHATPQPEYQEPEVVPKGYRTIPKKHPNPALPSIQPPPLPNPNQPTPSYQYANTHNLAGAHGHSRPAPHSPDFTASLGKVSLVNSNQSGTYTDVYEAKRLDPEYSSVPYSQPGRTPPVKNPPAVPTQSPAASAGGENVYALYDYTASSRYKPPPQEAAASGKPSAALLAALRVKQKPSPQVMAQQQLEDEYATLNISAVPFNQRRSSPQPQELQYELAGAFQRQDDQDGYPNDNLYDEVGSRN